MSFWKPAASDRENIKSRFQNLGKQQWIVLLLLGLLLAVAMLPVSGKEKNVDEPAGFGGQSIGISEEERVVNQTELEEKLEEILSSVEGVGEVRVMLMTAQESSQGFSASAVQKVTGALITAEGADNSVTIQKIQEAVMALFQVEAHKIKVMKMK